MPDPRYRELARLLVTHSTRLEKGDNVLIESTHVPPAMITALVEEATAVGAVRQTLWLVMYCSSPAR